jgi:quercetin dioxygenase-like cupin family protein
MRKIAMLTVASTLVAGAFVAGVAVGKGAADPAKFIAAEEVKWDDLPGGLKIGSLTGDYKKSAYGALLKIPAGFTSPLHSHTATYEAIEISGTTSHWLKGEDGTKAKKMTPGSYWTMQAKAEHVSSCAAGADCVAYIWQKAKFDVIPAAVTDPATGAGAAAKPGAGSAAKK